MDGNRFDAITKSLATRQSRRGVLRTLGAGLAAGLGALGLGRAGAAPGGQGNGGGKPQGRCPTGYTNCRGTCVDIDDNPNHCGACNLVCSPGKVCINGSCGCTTGQTDCGGQCVDCPVGGVCNGTTCVCPAETTNCGGVCATCPVGGVCNGTTCECPAGTTLCGGACVSDCPTGMIVNPPTCACICDPNACPSGKVPNAETCACECVETSCCQCVPVEGGAFCLSDGFSDLESCRAACEAEAGTTELLAVSFHGFPGFAVECGSTGSACVQTCSP